jgi:hypothetical protein
MTEYTHKERRERFVEILFTPVEEGGAGGDATKAKVMAGYHPTYSTRHLLSSKEVQDLIEKYTKELFTQTAPESALAILHILRNPAVPGSAMKLAAAKELLDRGGFTKTEKVQVETSGGLFILPPKDD